MRSVSCVRYMIDCKRLHISIYIYICLDLFVRCFSVARYGLFLLLLMDSTAIAVVFCH